MASRIYLRAKEDEDTLVLESDGRFGVIDGGCEGGDAVEAISGLGVNASNCEFYLATHHHHDHIGEADEIIRAFLPKRVYVPYLADDLALLPGQEKETKACYRRLVEAARETGAYLIQDLSWEAPLVPQEKGYAPYERPKEGGGLAPMNWDEVSTCPPFFSVASPCFDLGRLNVRILCFSDWYRGATFALDPNFFSWALLVSHPMGAKALLMGDVLANLGAEAWVARQVGHVDFLKVGHHGRGDVLRPSFLDAVGPCFMASTGCAEYLEEKVWQDLVEREALFVTMGDVAWCGADWLEVTFGDDGHILVSPALATDLRSIHEHGVVPHTYE